MGLWWMRRVNNWDSLMDFEVITKSCVQCGFCCRRAPCPYGAVDDRGGCMYLEQVSEIPTYKCGRYDHILAQPGWELCPAFGGGCSSTLFNDDRERVLRAMRRA
jgi:hypothetical protein